MQTAASLCQVAGIVADFLRRADDWRSNNLTEMSVVRSDFRATEPAMAIRKQEIRDDLGDPQLYGG
jgi:hypothetical protein